MEDLKNRVDELLENQEYDKALELLTENEMNGETDTWTNSTTGWILGKLGRRESRGRRRREFVAVLRNRLEFRGFGKE